MWLLTAIWIEAFTVNPQRSFLSKKYRLNFINNRNSKILHVIGVSFYIGFSTDQYDNGNEVYFENIKTKDVLQCKVVITDSNEKRIACETP